MLTYTVGQRYEGHKTVELKAHTNWGMFTVKGNQSLQKKAQGLIDSIDLDRSEKNTIKSIRKFYKGYINMTKCKTYLESSDTAVRETVWGFLYNVAKAIHMDADMLEYILEKYM